MAAPLRGALSRGFPVTALGPDGLVGAPPAGPPSNDTGGSGYGRTGTALACLAVLDGVPCEEAVADVRAHYAARAVETPWQRRFVVRCPGASRSQD